MVVSLVSSMFWANYGRLLSSDITQYHTASLEYQYVPIKLKSSSVSDHCTFASRYFKMYDGTLFFPRSFACSRSTSRATTICSWRTFAGCSFSRIEEGAKIWIVYKMPPPSSTRLFPCASTVVWTLYRETIIGNGKHVKYGEIWIQPWILLWYFLS